MGTGDLPLGQHVRSIPQDELVPETPQHDQGDDIGEVSPMGGYPDPSVEAALTQTTAQAAVSLFGASGTFDRRDISRPTLQARRLIGWCA